MIAFPSTAKHQEAHNQVWQRFLRSLNDLDDSAARRLLWAVATDMRYSLGIRGAVVAHFEVGHGFSLQFQSHRAVAKLGLNDVKQTNLMAAVEQYNLMSQLVLMVIYDTPIADQFWVDTMVLDVEAPRNPVPQFTKEPTESSEPPTFGQVILQARKEKQLTQAELAGTTGVTVTYISKLENDKSEYPPKEEVIRLLARILELDEEELICLAGRVPRNAEPFIKRYYREISALLRRFREDPDFTDKLLQRLND